MVHSKEQILESRKYDQQFGVQRSSRYHNHRRRFYEQWNTMTVAIAALGGLFAIFVYQLGYTLPAFLIALVVSLSGMFTLAIGAAGRANLHAELAREFILLEAEFLTSPPTDEDSLNTLIKARLQIESREPTKLHLLDAMCHFELLRAMGDVAEHYEIPWLRRKLAHWFSQAGYAQVVAAAEQQ